MGEERGVARGGKGERGGERRAEEGGRHHVFGFLGEEGHGAGAVALDGLFYEAHGWFGGGGALEEVESGIM